MSPRLLLAAALLFLPAAQAQVSHEAEAAQAAQADAHQVHMQRLATALARDGGARELALAALLRGASAPRTQAPDDPTAPPPPPPRDAQAEAWLRTAATKAGDDLAANRLLVLAAGANDGAVRLEAARRWQAAEPDNLVPMLHAGLTVEALLAQARNASRADAGMYPSVRWIASAWQRHPPNLAEQAAMSRGQPFHGDEAAAVSAMALWAASADPGYDALVEGCSEQMLRALPARRGDCAHVARLLADRSTNIADEHAGLAMLGALASTPAARSELQARLRRMDWRMLEWGRLGQQQPRYGAEQFARLLADPTITSEQQLVERVLQEGGVAADPPPGWAPPRR